MSGSFHGHSHVLIALMVPLNILNSFASQFQTRTGINAGRNSDTQRVQFAHSPCAPATGAGLFDHGPLAVALVACSGDAEESLLKIDLASAAAGRASLGCGAWLGAAAVAGFTRSMSRDFDLLLGTGNSFFEGKRQIVTEIFTPAAAAAPARAAPEEFAKDITEDIFEARREVETSRERPCIAEGCMAELIILRPLLRI